MVPQPSHAALSGYLTAHWGNRDFTPPGHYLALPQSGQIRAEVVHAVAHHDNGWWEWETEPELDPADGLPLDLSRISQRQGIDRWRMGILRFTAWRPYTSLLISGHARWLHVHQADPGADPSFRHPILQFLRWPALAGPELEVARGFIQEIEDYEAAIAEEIGEDPVLKPAVEPAMLLPHMRLLQLTDALSLYMCFGSEEEMHLPDTPVARWEERVTIRVTPLGDGCYRCQPYPFDLDPLPVSLIARIAELPCPRPEIFGPWWQSLPPRELRFLFTSQE
jgi:hypothetical protein